MAAAGRTAPLAGCLGIGIDLVELGELSQIMTQRPRMLARVFTRGELAYCRARPVPMQHLAARFAAKEAAFKAIGTGWAKGVTWRDAEVVATDGGAPRLVARGELARRAKALGASGFHVSLSHSGSYATAVVILVGSVPVVGRTPVPRARRAAGTARVSGERATQTSRPRSLPAGRRAR